MLTLDDRVVGWHLGLGDLAAVRGCWGYATCCNCPECIDRENHPLEALTPRQPWESKREAA